MWIARKDPHKPLRIDQHSHRDVCRLYLKSSGVLFLFLSKPPDVGPAEVHVASREPSSMPPQDHRSDHGMTRLFPAVSHLGEQLHKAEMERFLGARVSALQDLNRDVQDTAFVLHEKATHTACCIYKTQRATPNLSLSLQNNVIVSLRLSLHTPHTQEQWRFRVLTGIPSHAHMQPQSVCLISNLKDKLPFLVSCRLSLSQSVTSPSYPSS